MIDQVPMSTMKPGSNRADQIAMRMQRSGALSEDDHARLVFAIETALEVTRSDQFRDWMRGPFRALLPHESVICMALGGRGEVRRVDFLHHTPVDAALAELICDPERGLAMRLARSCASKTQLSCTMVADDIAALTDWELRHLVPMQNAVIHRTRLVSGAAYFVVLINVAEDRIDYCQQLFKLLSSHLKMALSRAVGADDSGGIKVLTEREREVLAWMAEGKSNREISVLLGISAMTLKHHIAKIYRKLDVQNRVDAVSRST
jgi:DNA-binding CsgD family transcriptional regulator